MKREDYFKIMEGASEQDITEMMQYHRCRHIPVRKEKITMTQTEHNGNTKSNAAAQPEIRMNRGRKYAATAVAAALLALNLGGGYMLLRNKDQQVLEPMQNVGCSLEDEITEIVTEQAEVGADIPAELPQYVQFMQQVYESRTGEPCHFDFTDFGTEINESWENESYKMTSRALVGCDWILFHFFDIEPKQGQSFADLWNDGYPSIGADVMNGDYSDVTREIGGLVSGDNTELDNGVWHCFNVVYNTTAKPFFHDEASEQANKYVKLTAYYGDDKYEIAEIPMNFVEKEYPIEEIVQEPAYIAKFGENGFVHRDDSHSVDRWLDGIAVNPLKYCSVTPFGAFYFSDTFETDGSRFGYDICYLGGQLEEPINGQYEAGIGSYMGYVQRNDENEIIRYIPLSWETYCGTHILENYVGRAVLHAIFQQPVDLTAGQVELAEDTLEEVTEEEVPAEDVTAEDVTDVTVEESSELVTVTVIDAKANDE